MREREREPDRKRSEEPDGATKPAGSDDEHSDAPGPHGTGEVYPRGERHEEGES